jgi:hypothetical protein
MMKPKAMTLACASSWTSPLSLPFWLPGQSRGAGKVRLHGTLHTCYPEYGRLVLQGADQELTWVSYDERTEFLRVQPEELKLGDKLRVDGLLQAGRLQATAVKRV